MSELSMLKETALDIALRLLFLLAIFAWALNGVDSTNTICYHHYCIKEIVI